jgi:uncharacterized membrane protein YfcA
MGRMADMSRWLRTILWEARPCATLGRWWLDLERRVMSFLQAAFLFLAAVVAGALNSVAGGGSFISFPALVVVGVPEIRANATNTVALWPGALASIGPYRDMLGAKRQSLLSLGALSVIGGVAGAIVLLHTPKATFSKLIPFLLLGATLLFTFGPRLTAVLRMRLAARAKAGPSWLGTLGVGALLLAMAFYGGFFGGGLSILLLALLALLGMENIHEMNALKVLLNALINGVAVVTFVKAGAVVWPDALVMIGGSTIGGFGGAFFARKLEPLVVRRFVIGVGVAMTLYFFIRAFIP